MYCLGNGRCLQVERVIYRKKHMKTGIKLAAVALLSGVLLGCNDLTELNRMFDDSEKREKRVLEQIDKIRVAVEKQQVELDKMEVMIVESARILAENNSKIAENNKKITEINEKMQK